MDGKGRATRLLSTAVEMAPLSNLVLLGLYKFGVKLFLPLSHAEFVHVKMSLPPSDVNCDLFI
jgi:hypothetical protein